MLAVIFVLAATLTLLPAVLAKLGPRVDKLALPWAHSGEHRSARFAAWGERLWQRPLRLRRRSRSPCSLALAIPVIQLHTAMPSIKVVPTADSSRIGYRQVQAAFGPGATGPLQIVDAARAGGRRDAKSRVSDPGVAALMPTQTSGGYALITAIAKQDPSSPAVGRRSIACAPPLPAGVADRRRGGREPRPPGRAVDQDAAGDRRRARARLPAPADRAAGAPARGRRRAHQPAGDRRRLRRREAGSSRTARCTRCSASSPRASSTPGDRSSSSR